MMSVEGVNDFVIRFANVNGTGSASANNLFAKAIFRLGVPVSPKNIFPSNIQGLPTWFEVRVSEKGHLGRRGGYDFVVAVNGQTMRRDYDDLAPGGYFLFDSTRQLAESYQRDDINVIGIPLTEMCNREITNPRLRMLLKNIVYVGALSYLLDLDFSVLSDSIKTQFSKKPKLAEPNIQALTLGFTYASEHFHDTCKLSIRPSKVLTDHIMMNGNSATALGAIYGGATVVGWYPITPSTSVVEAFDTFVNRYRLDANGKKKAAILQAEDELAALGIAMGASWNGARAFTATSGPGISLMNEFLGLAYFAEIPVVLINVQRAGPSTGMPTRTQQSDVLPSAYASHGDTKHILLIPSEPKECFEMTADSFDIADKLQCPVIVLSDLDLGMNDNISLPMQWDDKRQYERGKVLNAQQLEELAEKWGRYHDVDKDGICYRTIPGTHPEHGSYFTRGSSHDEYAVYTEDNETYRRCMQRLSKKWLSAKDMIPPADITIHQKKSKNGVVFYGSSTASCNEAVEQLAELGTAVNTMRLKSFPFGDEVADFIDKHTSLFIVEQNRDSQMRTLLINELGISPDKLISVTNYDGMPITATSIRRSITTRIDTIPPSHKQQRKGADK